VAHKKPVIHDRLFFSELVYGEVLRGGACFNWAEQKHVLRVLTAISPPIIFCIPPLEAIHAKIYGADQMEGATEKIDKIYAKYAALSTLTRPAIIRYDYTRGPAAKAKVVKAVTAYLERRNKRAWSPTSTTSST
jgi:thymidylate kinase